MLAHNDETDINDRRVYEHLHLDLEWFPTFLREIRTWLGSRTDPGLKINAGTHGLVVVRSLCVTFALLFILECNEAQDVLNGA